MCWNLAVHTPVIQIDISCWYYFDDLLLKSAHILAINYPKYSIQIKIFLRLDSVSWIMQSCLFLYWSQFRPTGFLTFICYREFWIKFVNIRYIEVIAMSWLLKIGFYLLHKALICCHITLQRYVGLSSTDQTKLSACVV